MEQNNMEKRFDRLETKVDEILDALTGNPRLGSKGLVTRVNSLENWKWVAMSLGGLGTVIAGLLKFNII
jgi:hypothetical protein